MRILWLVLATSTGLAQADVNLPVSPQVASLERRAMELYNSGKLAESEQNLYQVLSLESSGPAADLALEYLQKIAVGTGAVDYAIKHYRELKRLNLVTEDANVIADRIASLNAIRTAGKVKAHLAAIFKAGGVLAARSTLFAFIISDMGLPPEASYFLDRADAMIQETQRMAYVARRSYLVERPLQFDFSQSVYGRGGILKYSPGQYQIIPFEMQQNASSDIELQGSLDGWRPHVSFAYAPTYDSNVVNSFPTSTNLGSSPRKDGMENNLLINIGAEGNIQKPISYGFDYTYYNRSHPRGDLSAFDYNTNIASLWVSTWNRMNNEVRFRFDAGFTGHDPTLLGPFSRSYGPEFSIAHLFDTYRIDLKYDYKYNLDSYDPDLGDPNRRGGYEHILSATISYPGKVKDLQPFAGYAFDRNLADGWNWSTITHSLRAGTYYLIGDRSSLELTGSTDFVIYPALDRVDILKELNFGVSLPALQDLLVFIFNADYQFQSSPIDLYSYNRWRVGLTTIIHLDL